ncbi:hypothetical protein [Sandaracinus amylolyticus]|nr:hypothetical protein [Sandaracinus amylolyticus]
MSSGMGARAWLAVVAALFAVACGDSGGGDVPAADGGGLGSESDSGPVSCTAEMANAASTVGCNGGFQGEPAENEPGGRCTPGTDEMPAGTCSTEMSICMGDLTGSGMGWCVNTCAPPEALIDAQTCPSGYRCFRMGTGVDAYGLCYRDCDAEHPCQEGWTCNPELGRCEETPPS